MAKLRMFQKMKESNHLAYYFIFFLAVFIFPVWVSGQQKYDSLNIRYYVKKEQTSGALFHVNKEREELLTDNSKQYEEISTGAVKFQFSSRFWNYLDFKQEQLKFNIELAPLWGSGNWIDSTYIENSVADYKIAGIRANGFLAYTSRFYYNDKEFTLVQVNAQGRYDLFRKHSEGISIDSNERLRVLPMCEAYSVSILPATER